MASRTDLHTLLKSVIGSDNVYFQPPSTYKMSYPCIVYERSKIDTIFSNNYPYKLAKRYTITVIDGDPDSIIPDKVAMLQSCMFDRHFVLDNLNHDVFDIFF